MKCMLPVKILAQPDDVTCGPTSLHAVYNYYGDKISLQQVIDEVDYLEDGGTLAVMLGIHALKRGYKVTLLSYNLYIFDPTWFLPKKVNLYEKLEASLSFRKQKKAQLAIRAYMEYLKLGGVISFEDPRPSLLRKYFEQNCPILTGLSATYLYKSMREYTAPDNSTVYDDLRGAPGGHFVVLCGYSEKKQHVVVSDPYKENPVSHDHYYKVKVGRLINAIMLGIITYDANLLMVQPGQDFSKKNKK